jgi:glycosyltransferase involved in cell wall biosynthesis
MILRKMAAGNETGQALHKNGLRLSTKQGAVQVYKLVYWNSFSVGIAPVIIGLFFFSSVQLIFLGVIGEYIGAIYTQTLKRPLVIEKERINF